MRLSKLIEVVLMITAPGFVAIAQQSPSNPGLVTSRTSVAAGYNLVRANAPPGGCECFGLNGAFVSADYHFNDVLGVAAEVTYGHANKISLLNQNLTLVTYLAGPRITLPGRRIMPYVQALFGAAHGSDSYFPTGLNFTTSATSFSLSAGGGIDVRLTHLLSIRAIEAQYLKTGFPNNADNSQTHLMLGTGIVFKFGGHGEVLRPATPKPTALQLSCDTTTQSVTQGQAVEIVATSDSGVDDLDVAYRWSSSGGVISGSGRRISVGTAGLTPGTYKVRGRAALVSNRDSNGSCETSFSVMPPPPPPPPPPAPVAAAVIAAPDPSQLDRTFHEHVRDALFDYDSSELRPDAQTAINEAATYLKANPNILVQVGGYSDERGTTDYNLSLSEKRAKAARDGLIAQGIEAGRIEIVSYGKNVQVCTAENEQCWQQNRRAAFRLRP